MLQDVAPKTHRYPTYTLSGIAVFVAISVILDFIEPNYDAASQTLSDHLNNDYRWVMFVALSSLGLACWALAGAVRTAFVAPIQSKLTVRLLVIAGSSFIVASIFPANPDTLDTTLGTASTVIHVVAAFAAFISLLIVMNALSNRLRKAGLLQGRYQAMRWLARLGPLLLILLIASGQSGYVGIVQRVLFGVFFGWMSLLAVGIRSRELINQPE